MSTQRISANASGNDRSASINLHKHATQSAGLWGEITLWLLLAAFLLMLLADAAYAAERGTSIRIRSANAGVPTYNIEAICRGTAAHVLETTVPDNAQNCREDEHRAREQLVKEWSQFDMTDRSMCDGAAQSGTVEPAYTELMTCLEMTRDNHSREARAHLAQRSDQPQPSTAVGAAPVQGTGSIRNALAGR
jgi:hypothetical protein